jgi:hypothetical protein
MSDKTPTLTTSGKLYAVFPLAPKQKKAVDDHCFGDCGRISMGGMLMTDYGLASVCSYDNCPHLDEDTTDPVGKTEWTGEDVYFRVLKVDE